MEKKKLSRRGFLKTASAAAAGSFLFPYVIKSSALGAESVASPSNRIVVGCIGVGPQGSYDMSNFLAQQDVQVVAVCDVKSNVLSNAADQVNNHYGNKDCKKYSDFRDLLARDDIDAVLIATPDHWHILIAIAAAKAGKDMYLEKPLGVSLHEDKALFDTIKKFNRVFQFGTQQRSDKNFRLACELARNEYIGKLHTINNWCPGSIEGGSTEPAPVPEWLDYQMWLGPAPFTPYTPDRCSNSLWWFISDYSLGWISAWGVHPLDIVLWGGGDKTKGNLQIEGNAVWPKQGVCDTAIDWNVTCHWDTGITMNYTANPIPDEWQKRYKRVSDHGTAFEGSEGWVHVDRAGINAYPESLLKVKFKPSDLRLINSNHHVRNFIDCVKSRSQTVCSIDDALAADTLCHLSDIATKVNTKLNWDAQKSVFTNSDAANRFLNRAMRSPWHL